MSENQIADPVHYFAQLGGLHDVWINKISYDAEQRCLVIGLDDIDANFEGLPDYAGVEPCVLAFENVERVLLDVETNEGICISAARVFKENSLFRLELDLRLGGRDINGRSIVVIFSELLKISESR